MKVRSISAVPQFKAEIFQAAEQIGSSVDSLDGAVTFSEATRPERKRKGFEKEGLMKGQKLYLFFILLVVLASGCGQPAQAVPTVDSSARETALAGTAVTAFGTPTPIPTPTETLVPTPKISNYGTLVQVAEDGTALFIDHKAGIQLTIPAGWLTVRVNEDEYYKAYSLGVVLENSAIADRLTKMQSANLDFHRLDAIDIRAGHIPAGIISVINVSFQQGDNRTLEKWAQAERVKKQPYAGFQWIQTSYPRTADGTRVLQIEESWNAEKVRGRVYYRGIVFSLPSGTLILNFYTNDEFKDTVLPEFEQVVNGLTLLTP